MCSYIQPLLHTEIISLLSFISHLRAFSLISSYICLWCVPGSRGDIGMFADEWGLEGGDDEPEHAR